MKKLLLIALLLAGGSLQAATYTYTGTLFTNITNVTPPTGTYTDAMSVTGQFSVAAPLAANLGMGTDITGQVTSFSFFDGRNTITEVNAPLANFDYTFLVTTDGAGNISGSNITVSRPLTPLGVGGQAWTIFVGTGGSTGTIEEVLVTGPNGFDIGESITPGTWTLIPIPATVWLFGSALGLLGWVRRRTA